MDDESKPTLQGTGDQSTRQDSTEDPQTESPVDEVEVEIVSREMAPAHFKELKSITDALVTGRMPVKKALTQGDPALRAHIEHFVDKYAFATDPETLEALRKAKIVEGLTNPDLIISLTSVRLAQKEAELDQSRDDHPGGLSDEVQQVVDRIKREKRKAQEKKESE